MTKYGKALAEAKKEARETFGGMCVVTSTTKWVDACHIYDAGWYKDFNYFLIDRGILARNLVLATRQIHRHLDMPERKNNPQLKLKYLMDSTRVPITVSSWTQPLLIAVIDFMNENGGQIKWRHGKR